MNGIFPMSNSREDKEVFFVDPEYRTLIPIKGFHFSKSLKRLIKKRPFNITINKCFPDVIRACAIFNRDETWINLRIQNLFISAALGFQNRSQSSVVSSFHQRVQHEIR